jgi:ABC-type bacteriocin/lantibiotic exporter with double-glycine peptidase domain
MSALTLAALLLATPPADSSAIRLPVPVIRQARERCGPAALEMVLRFYGADSTAARVAAATYDPVLRGALITDLAAAARRAGFDARIETLETDDLTALLRTGVPPILLYQSGDGPVTRPHYGVVIGWDGRARAFVLNDGASRPHMLSSWTLARRWKTAGRQALLVRRRAP